MARELNGERESGGEASGRRLRAAVLLVLLLVLLLRLTSSVVRRLLVVDLSSLFPSEFFPFLRFCRMARLDFLVLFAGSIFAVAFDLSGIFF